MQLCLMAMAEPVEGPWVLKLLHGRDMDESLKQQVAETFADIEEEDLRGSSLQDIMSLLPAAISGKDRVNVAMSLKNSRCEEANAA